MTGWPYPGDSDHLAADRIIYGAAGETLTITTTRLADGRYQTRTNDHDHRISMCNVWTWHTRDDAAHGHEDIIQTLICRLAARGYGTIQPLNRGTP